MTPSAANAEEREILGIKFCPTCEVDTLILDDGHCAFCHRNPVTGHVDRRQVKLQVEESRKRRNLSATHRYRERQREQAA